MKDLVSELYNNLIYSGYDHVLLVPFFENSTKNLIAVHLENTMPYRSTITHLKLSSLLPGYIPPIE